MKNNGSEQDSVKFTKQTNLYYPGTCLKSIIEVREAYVNGTIFDSDNGFLHDRGLSWTNDGLDMNQMNYLQPTKL